MTDTRWLYEPTDTPNEYADDVMLTADEDPVLTPDLLLSAYAQGIFPMDVDGRIQWFSPDPRAVFELHDFSVPRSLRQAVRQGRFEVRVDTAFADVIRACADRSDGTWISEAIIEAYTRLHHLGFAHSVETCLDGELVGGLYGVSLGGAFFGESMFHRATDASKVALVHLVERLDRRGYQLLDIQFVTEHLLQFGAKEIPRAEYLHQLEAAMHISCTFTD